MDPDMEDESLESAIEEIIRKWRILNQSELTKKKELTYAKETYWTLRPGHVEFEGIIHIIIRENKFGPLTLQNANDNGWYRIIGATPQQLPGLLDDLKEDLFSEAWKVNCEWI